jgi:hypothetical protein
MVAVGTMIVHSMLLSAWPNNESLLVAKLYFSPLYNMFNIFFLDRRLLHSSKPLILLF